MFLWEILTFKNQLPVLSFVPCRKDALAQYAQATDLTQAYQDSFAQFYEMLKQVDKEEEYVQFIHDNKQ